MIRMNTDDIKRQLDSGEDSYWEFKQVEFRSRRGSEEQLAEFGITPLLSIIPFPKGILCR